MRRQHVLLTQGRSASALCLARQLHRCGHRVVTVDSIKFTVCSYSNAVHRALQVRSPRRCPDGFIEDVRQIVHAQRIDCIVPIFEEGLYLAQDPQLAARLFAPPFAQWRALHDKYSFAQVAQAAGLLVPHTVLLRCQADLAQLDRSQRYAIKPCYSQAALHLVVLRPGDPLPQLPLSPQAPYVAQAWVDGQRYCSYGVYRDGVVQAHAVYPVDYTIDGHSCVYFRAVAHPKVDAWAHSMAAHLRLTGQAAYDFIEAADGKLYAIECNPRATSGVHLFADSPQLAQAIAGAGCFGAAGAKPPVRRARQVATGMLMYVWRRRVRPRRSFWAYLKTLVATPDAVWSRADPLPALTQPLALGALLQIAWRLGCSLPAAFLFDFVWRPRQHAAPPAVASGCQSTLDGA
jgi:hypothetical protein